MNPITTFEKSVSTIWRRPCSAAEKTRLLESTHEAIVHYTVRCRARLDALAQEAHPQRAFLSQNIAHLEALAKNCVNLAEKCRFEAKEAANSLPKKAVT